MLSRSCCCRVLGLAENGTVRLADAAGVLLRSTTACPPVRSKPVASLEPDKGWADILAGLGSQDLPGRLVLLNGAPGSGKGTMVSTINNFTGIPTSFTMSSVIATSREIPDSVTSMTGLVSDDEACRALTRSLASIPVGAKDVILDGFPRSHSQVDYLEQLLSHIEAKRVSASRRASQPALDVFMVQLNISEETSVERQMQRHWEAAQHNAEVRRTGRGHLQIERETDKSEDKCRERYAVYARSLGVLDRIRKLMPVYEVDAEGAIGDCKHEVADALIRHQERRREAAAAAAGVPTALGVLGGHTLPAGLAGTSAGALQKWHEGLGWPPAGLVWS